MKQLIPASLLCLAAVTPAFASNDPVNVTLESVLEMPEAKAKLDDTVKFYLAGKWAALSALISLHDRAVRDGADAVVEIVSRNKHETFSSPTDLRCLDGTFVGGIALKGTFVKIGK